VEITSPHDRSRDKLDFYGQVGTRELLIVDRDRWVLEMYRLDGRKLKLDSSSSREDGNRLLSNVLGMTLRLIPGRADQTRPAIEVARLNGLQKWII
jgi:Uma2 family endonuclease